MTYSIVPIVEGHSEVESIPVLMRRLLNEWGKFQLEIEKPVRAKRNQILREGELERRVALAVQRPNCSAIVLVLDADDDCPKVFAPAVLKRLGQAAYGKLVSVVFPKSELESWFVGSIESLRGSRGISSNACSPNNPESIRDAKGHLSKLMEGNRHYLEVDDQPSFAEQFNLDQALSKCRSFRKFYNDLRRIANCLNP